MTTRLTLYLAKTRRELLQPWLGHSKKKREIHGTGLFASKWSCLIVKKSSDTRGDEKKNVTKDFLKSSNHVFFSDTCSDEFLFRVVLVCYPCRQWLRIHLVGLHIPILVSGIIVYAETHTQSPIFQPTFKTGFLFMRAMFFTTCHIFSSCLNRDVGFSASYRTWPHWHVVTGNDDVKVCTQVPLTSLMFSSYML